MKAEGLSQIIVTDDHALFYLTGQEAWAMERVAALLIKDTGTTDMFVNQLITFPPQDGLTMHYHSDADDPYADLAAALNPGAVGVDQYWYSKHTIALIAKRDDLFAVNGSGPINVARSCKDAKEADLLRSASLKNDKVVEYAIGMIDPDLTEKELAHKVEEYFLELGADSLGDMQLVCYGPGAADVHHEPNDTRLKPGDAVLFDLWATYDKYWCDMTRTVFYKEVSDEHRKVYEIVKRAQQAAIDAVRPGIVMKEVDAAARAVITEAGYGPQFLTRTGHGVGISVHETPDASPVCDVIAQPGMVFSIEPGIYLEGDVGVRIEDLVMVTEDGCEVLTNFTKELLVIG
jgi:Xaa-Pro dipeptidase